MFSARDLGLQSNVAEAVQELSRTMGSCEEYSSVSLPETPDQTEPPSGFNQEDSLVEGFKTLALEDNEWNSHEEDSNSQNLGLEWQNGENCQHPLRPYAEDCRFYLKTGNCKFGLNCKFNHPVGRGFQDEENHEGWTAEQTGKIDCKYYCATGGCRFGKACRYKHSNEDDVLTPLQGNSFSVPVQEGIKEMNEKAGFVEQMGQIECKYYLTSGGCKYGRDCRYSHSKEKSRYPQKSELPLPQLNFLGLPIRMLEKECPYYMRTGSCGYGSNCRFNHPEPTTAAGSNTFKSAPSGFGGHSSGNYNGGSDFLPWEFEPTAPSLSSSTMLDKHVLYLDHNSSYSHGRHLNSEWNGRQGKTSHPCLAPSMPNGVKMVHVSELHQVQIQGDELPERPGAAECPYFMKTGHCKFKAGCKFHHPKTRPSKPPAVNLSSVGLPLRPDRRICWNYEKFGICKYGESCHFHHPENLLSSSALLVDQSGGL